MNTRYYSSKQEKRVAKEFNGKTVANSGAAMFCGGDVNLENFLVECKTSTKPKDSMSIKKEWLTKIKEEAIAKRKRYYALTIDFGSQDDYFVIDKNTFKLLVDYVNKLEGGE